MKNLAGDPDCDREIRRELTRARIPIVRNPPPRGEVPATLQGELGPILFTRAWRYWVARGPVPIEIARTLYEDPVGKTDIRSGGHCGCPAPDEYGARYYDADGRELHSDPDGSEQRTLEELFITRETITRADLLYRLVPDKKVAAVRVVVDCYHIDSELGLRIFADAIRELKEESH